MRKLVLIVGTAVLCLFATAATAGAWDCPPGVPDTKENQDKGLCVETTPTPTPTPTPPKKHQHHHKKPTILPSPTTPATPTTSPTSSPTTVTPATATTAPLSSPLPPPAPTAPPVASTTSSTEPSHKPGQVCIQNPDTGQWDIHNNHFGDVLEAGHEWPIEKDLCDQHHPPAPTPRPAAAPRPPAVAPPPQPAAATPAPAPEAPPQISACIYGDLVPILNEEGSHMLDEATGLPMWLVNGDESGEVMLGMRCPITPPPDEAPAPPVVVVPEALPETGDGSTATEFVP